MINNNLEDMLHLIFDKNGNVVKKLVFVIGSGCSKEYGMPTFKEFIKSYFDNNKDNEIIKKIEKCGLTTDVIDSFSEYLKNEKEEVRRKKFLNILKKKNEAVAYKILCSLMENDICDIVFTTNYDSLLEEACGNIITKTHINLKNITGNQPITTIADKLLVKLAGDLNGATPLIGDNEFDKILSKRKNIIKTLIGSNNIVFIGYVASEKYLQGIWNELCKYLNIIIVSNDICKITKNIQCENFMKIELYCEQFFIRLSDILYNKGLKDLYSFSKLKEEALGLIMRIQNLQKDKFIKHQLLNKQVVKFLKSKENILLLIGESGIGKSYYLQYKTLNYNRKKYYIAIYLNAISLTDNKLSEIRQKIDELSYFEKYKVCLIFDDFHLSHLEMIKKIITFANEITLRKNIKLILSLRKGLLEYIESKLELDLSFIKSKIIFPYFNNDMITKGFQKYSLTNIQNDIFKLPIFLKIASQLKNTQNIQLSNLHLLAGFGNNIIKDNTLLKALEYIYKEFDDNQSLTINLMQYNNNINNIEKLQNLGILSIDIDMFDRYITIQNELINEFLFGNIYLSLKFKSFNDKDVQERFVNCINSIQNDTFKIFVINAARYMIATSNDSIIKSLLFSKYQLLQSLTKEALTEKLALEFDENYLNDYFLTSIMLLSSSNFEKIYSFFNNGKQDISFFDELSFYLVANKHKQIFKKFIYYTFEKNNLNIAFNCFVIYCAYNGIEKNFFKDFKNYLQKFKTNYILDMVFGNIDKLYTFIFYGSQIDKSRLDNFFYGEKDYFQVFKELLNCGLKESDIDILIALIDIEKDESDMLSWIFAQVLLFKDAKNGNKEIVIKIINKLFSTGKLRLQDFTLTILGHLSKYNKEYLEYLTQKTVEMKQRYKNNFYSKSIGNDNKKESQYDPWVPLLSSRIYYRLDIDEIFKEFFDIDEQYIKEDMYNITRILYKLAIDYPKITIKAITKALTEITRSKDRKYYINKLYKILNVIRLTHPSIFWKNANLSLTKIIKIEKKDINKQSINQIHDWNWYKILNSIDFNTLQSLLDNMTKKSIEEFLNKLIRF